MNKGILALFGATLLIVLMAATMTGITNFRATSTSYALASTTGGGVTSQNVTLPLAVLDDTVLHVTSVTSNNTADNPSATAYASKVVTIGGLAASNSRLLTIAYRAPSLDAYTAVDLAAKWWPLFLVVGIIGVVIGALVKSFSE